ncbi:aryl-alcohol dehydrogenase-like predicted oxidoreductase [Pontibacter ummariensis]|uniref:Predicted oxidoreductase n=1 Tax=Pontibacter ummariensis TaxID=1610492 RepID=A0A239F7F0_9BACT|nr:aldo/keto reductase [Pontibacter ummariensis]PRY12415.1 aryl-alcohol dehydrogenase-like predicted oxidoreductase [Pontibacter ummariensis]SNS52213.1 Predicted oxidoreductase [Pontibacter ummariensis]
MQYRKLGKTGFEVSEVSLGTWQVGGRWGDAFDEQNAAQIINKAIDEGVNFIDTADVYSEGQSEAAVAKVVKSRSEQVYIATKCGRQISPHTSEGYTPERLKGFVEQSLRNMQLETLDLIQLHCPPTEVYNRPEIFETFEKLKEQGKIRNLGVSVELVDEALLAMQYPNVTTVQIIYNMFRLKPGEEFFSKAKENNVGIISRVPLASGLLTGKMSPETKFGPEDHRTFNRQGEAFDKGETFSGVDFHLGLEAVEELRKVFPGQEPLAAWALRWVLMSPEVSTVIPGASRPDQVEANIKASNLPALSQEQMQAVQQVYDQYIRPSVHELW